MGTIIGLKDSVVFHGTSVAELETSFRESVDDYLAACKALGQEPNKPYSGKILLRVPIELHAAVAALAEARGTSINKLTAQVLKEACL